MAATVDELGIRIVVDASGISGLDQVSSSVQSSMQRMSGAIANAARTAAGLAVSIAGIHSAFDAFSAGFSFNSEMQQAEISFETMLGGIEQAQEKIIELQDLALDTPFEFPQLQTTTKKLLAFGFAADEIKTDLIAMGDAAAGLSLGAAGVDRIGTALGQMKAKGKVSAEEMLQLAEAGIPAWDILAKSIGKSTAETMKLAENGAIPADKAIKALIAGMEERFPNMMAKQSKSFAGMLSTIKDSFNTAMGGIVQPGFNYLSSTVLPAVIETMDGFVKTLRAAGLAAAFKTIIPAAVVDSTVAASQAIGSAFELIGQHADLIKGSLFGLTAAFAAYRAITLASTIASTAHAVALALETGAVALATRGTVAFTLANIAATVSTAAAILATQGLTAAFSALAVAMNINPIVLAITAAMAVIAGSIYLVYTNWETFKSWLVSYWNSLVDIVADNIGMIMALFPAMGAVIYIIYSLWDDGAKLIQDLWNDLCNFVGKIANVFIKIIDSVAIAWPRFTAAAKQGIANFAAALAGLAERFIPDWAKSLYGQIVKLGNSLAAKTAEIGNSIRKNLSISVPGKGMADFRRSEDSNTMPDAPTTSEPTIPPIDWSGMSAAGKKGKGKDETEFERQKRLYENDVALHDYTQAEKLKKYKEYLTEVAKQAKEELDYNKGLKELEVSARKEQLEMERLDLETRIAEGKAGEAELLRQKIAMAARALATEREGTLAYKKLLKEKIDAEKAYFDWQYQQLQQKLERQKQHNDSLIALEEEKIRHLKALGLISDEEEIREKAALDEQAYNDGRTRLEQQLQAIKTYNGEESDAYKKKYDEILNLDDQWRLKALKNSNAIKEAQLKNMLEVKTSMTNAFSQAFQDIIKGTKSLVASIGSMLQSIGSTILKQFTDKWAKNITDKLFSKKLSGNKGPDQTRIAQETATQAAITGVAAAGNTARLTALKAANLAAGASGVASATAIVTANVAAFTALLAMISAMAAAVAAIPPDGPAMAAAMTGGVAAATGVLTGAASAATATISGSMSGIASFDVGTWSVPQDMLAMVHKGEPIIPAPFADSARKVLSGEMIPAGALGGAAGNGAVHLYYSPQVSMIDTRGAKKFFKSHARSMADNLSKVNRNFYNPGKK